MTRHRHHLHPACPPVLFTVLILFCVAGRVTAQGTLVDETPDFALRALSRITATQAGLHNEIVTTWAMNPTGTRVLVGFRSGRVMLWDVSTTPPSIRRNLVLADRSAAWTQTPYASWCSLFGSAVVALGFGRDKAFMVNRSGTFRTLDAATGANGITWNVPTAVSAAALAADGTTLALGTPRGGITLHTLATSPPSPLRSLRPQDRQENPVAVLGIDVDDDFVFSCLEDYAPSHDVENGGDIVNAGPTLWTLSTGARRFRFGAPQGQSHLIRTGPGTTALLAAGGDARFARVDLSTGAVVDFMGQGLGLETAMMNRSDPQGGLLVSAAGGALMIHRIPLEGGVWGQFMDKTVPEPLIGLVTAQSANRLATVSIPGGLYVYSVQTRSGHPSVKPLNIPLGQHFGKTLTVTRELIGHRRSVMEVRVSDDGTRLATRDQDHEVFLWTRRSDGGFSQERLPVNGPRYHGIRTRALDFWAGTLHVVGDDGNVHVFPRPFNPNNTLVITPMKGTRRKKAIAVRRVSASAALLATEDGALYQMHVPSGALVKQIVPRAEVLHQGRAGEPYSEFVGDLSHGYLVALPFTSSQERPPLVIDTHTLHKTAKLPTLPGITNVASWRDSVLLAEAPYLKLVTPIEAPGRNGTWGQALTDGGVMTVSNDLALAVSRSGALTMIKKSTSSPLPTSPVTPWLAGKVDACCAARQAPYVYLGGDNGKVLEITLSP